ncbi:MAG: hypothetical protein QM628_00375 [Propionicimonas sp.]
MARRIPGEFVPSDVNMRSHPEIRQAGCLAELLFRRGNEHVKATKRDGVIYKFDLEVFGVGIETEMKTLGVRTITLAKLAKKLTRVGLWEDRGDHWYVPGYLKWNHSQTEIVEAKDAKRLGAMKTNHRKHAEPDPDCPICKGEISI